MEALRLDDDPWRRLPWLATLGSALTFLSLMGFLRLLEQAPDPVSPARPVEVQIMEVAAPAQAPASAPVPPVAAESPAPPRKREISRPSTPAPVPPEPASPPRAEPAPPVALPRADVPEPSAPAAESPAPASPVISMRSSGISGDAPPTAAPPAPAARPAPSETASIPGAAAEGPPGGGKMSARAIHNPLPEIPDSLRRRNLDLVAVARFFVAANGAARVELTQPTSDPELNAALLESLKRWRFFPAMQDGKPVASTVDIRIPITVR
jgi:protein TonB